MASSHVINEHKSDCPSTNAFINAGDPRQPISSQQQRHTVSSTKSTTAAPVYLHTVAGRSVSSPTNQQISQPQQQVSFISPSGYPPNAAAAAAAVQCPGRFVINKCIGFYDDDEGGDDAAAAGSNTRNLGRTNANQFERSISNKYLLSIGIKSPNALAGAASLAGATKNNGQLITAPHVESTKLLPASKRPAAALRSRVSFDESAVDKNTTCASPSAQTALRKEPRAPFDPMQSISLPPNVQAQLAPKPHSKRLPFWLRRWLVRLYDLPAHVVFDQEDSDVTVPQQQHAPRDERNNNDFGDEAPLLPPDNNNAHSACERFLACCFGKLLLFVTLLLAGSSALFTCVHSVLVLVDGARQNNSTVNANDTGQSSRIFDVTTDVAGDLLWVAFGVYSYNLVREALRQPRFFNKIRMHARSVLRVNSVFIWISLLASFLTVMEIEAYGRFAPSVNPARPHEGNSFKMWSNIVCYALILTRIAYAVINFLWLCITGAVFLSICRTHTIGVLRLTHELDKDAKFYQQFVRENMTIVSSMMQLDEMRVPKSKNSKEKPVFRKQSHNIHTARSPPQTSSSLAAGISTSIADATLHSAMIAGSAAGFHRSISLRRRAIMRSGAGGTGLDVMGSPIAGSAFERHMSLDEDNNNITNSMRFSRRRTSSNNYNCPALYEKSESEIAEYDDDDDFARKDEPFSAPRQNGNVGALANAECEMELDNHIEQLGCNIMTNAELLYCYWKIKERLRATSVLFQSWLFIWFAFALVWTVFDLIQWLRVPPTLIDMALFILPLLLLPLLGSALAQANFEGQRMVAAICPLEHRVFILRMFNEMPLQLTVYGYQVTYTTLATSAVAVVLAVASKIILDELSPK